MLPKPVFAFCFVVSVTLIVAGNSAAAEPAFWGFEAPKSACNVPRAEWEDFGVKHAPPNCRVWTDGCNRHVRFDDGPIVMAKTLQACWNWCPSVQCIVRDLDALFFETERIIRVR